MTRTALYERRWAGTVPRGAQQENRNIARRRNAAGHAEGRQRTAPSSWTRRAGGSSCREGTRSPCVGATTRSEFALWIVAIEPIVRAVNHATRRSRFSRVYMLGLSGGGWTATLAAAVGPRGRSRSICARPLRDRRGDGRPRARADDALPSVDESPYTTPGGLTVHFTGTSMASIEVMGAG